MKTVFLEIKFFRVTFLLFSAPKWNEDLFLGDHHFKSQCAKFFKFFEGLKAFLSQDDIKIFFGGHLFESESFGHF